MDSPPPSYQEVLASEVVNNLNRTTRDVRYMRKLFILFF